MVPVAFAGFWGAIWGRLGPQEIYAAPVVGLMMLGGYELFFAPSALRRKPRMRSADDGDADRHGDQGNPAAAGLSDVFLVALAVAERRLSMRSGLLSGAVTLLFFFRHRLGRFTAVGRRRSRYLREFGSSRRPDQGRH